MTAEVLGRGAELAAVRAFVAAAEEPAAGPRALLIVGEPGIGKTTVWREGVRLAEQRGHRVLTCTAVDAEARLAYAALGEDRSSIRPSDSCLPLSAGPSRSPCS
jgi:DNA replication protein DnaC